jgi:Uma2 family endonuclease
VRRERLANLATEQKRKFLPLCPDCVIELRSPSDPLATLQAKMREYVENGAPGLLDPEERKTHVYKPGESARILNTPDKLSGDHVLTGFVLNLKQIWEPTL